MMHGMQAWEQGGYHFESGPSLYSGMADTGAAPGHTAHFFFTSLEQQLMSSSFTTPRNMSDVKRVERVHTNCSNITVCIADSVNTQTFNHWYGMQAWRLTP